MANCKNVIRCERGHFYNADEYKSCPHCASGKEPNTKSQRVVISPIVGKEDPNTMRFLESKRKWGRKKEKEGEYESRESGSEDDGSIHKQKKEKKQENVGTKSEDADTQALWDVIEKADIDQDDIPTQSIYGNVGKMPVGWLVVIEGPDLGNDYKLGDGKNMLGRNPNMDVSIKKDHSVSRDTHTVILYDTEGMEFYVLPNEGKGTTYINGSIALMPTKLSKGDLIKTGNTVMYFVPLCGEEFDWKNYFNRG